MLDIVVPTNEDVAEFAQWSESLRPYAPTRVVMSSETWTFLFGMCSTPELLWPDENSPFTFSPFDLPIAGMELDESLPYGIMRLPEIEPEEDS